MTVFIIAECAATWRFGNDHLANAKRLIEAVKSCGADAAKFQWTSSAVRIAERRHAPEYLAAYERLQFPREWLGALKRMCDEAGIEFMCTVYLPEDIAVIAPLVKRFKVSSFESTDRAFLSAHEKYEKDVIASSSGEATPLARTVGESWWLKTLLCVSAYPAPTEQMNLRRLLPYSDSILGLSYDYAGLSDHTTSVLTGAVAVGAGAEIIEKHVRMNGTPSSDPDRETAMEAECLSCDGQGEWGCEGAPRCFRQYVRLIREAERMMGTGEQGAMECEKAMMRYRVKP